MTPPITLPTVEFKPIPDACAKGILANKAINNVPIKAPIAVAMKTEDQRISLVPPKRIELGLTVKM